MTSTLARSLAKHGVRVEKRREGVEVSVREGWLKSFAAPFLARFGEESLFARAISDMWTTAQYRLLVAKEMLSEGEEIGLFADPEDVTVITELVLVLKGPLLQEPLGYVSVGAIETSFNSVFGTASFESWLEAFEQRKFATCRRITGPLSCSRRRS